MFDLPPIRTAEGKFVCNILTHKNLSRAQQHLVAEASSLLAEILGLSENRFQVIKSEQPSPGVPSNFRILSR
jgi:hypothetical protein